LATSSVETGRLPGQGEALSQVVEHLAFLLGGVLFKGAEELAVDLLLGCYSGEVTARPVGWASESRMEGQ
jgi:hypothetical protein